MLEYGMCMQNKDNAESEPSMQNEGNGEGK